MRLLVPASTHVLAAALGAFLWWNRTPEPDDPSTATMPDMEVAESLKDRLRRDTLEQARRDRRIERFAELTPAEEVSEFLAEERENNRIASARHLELITRSQAFDKADLTELNRILTNALVQLDDETAQAVFLSWYRRDPVAALDQLVVRPALLPVVTGAPEVTLVFDAETVARWVGQDHLPTKPRDDVLEGLAITLAAHDQLEGLKTVWSLVSGQQRENLAYCFVASWNPDDGAAAVETLFTSVPSGLRDAIIREISPDPLDVHGLVYGLETPLFGDQLFSDSPALDEAFATALLEHDLSHLERVTERLEDFIQQGNKPFDDSLIEEDAEAVVTRWTPGEAERQFENSMEDWLIADKDYPELIMAGRASLDETRDAIIKSHPPAADHPALLDRQLYASVFRYAPEEAASWAASRLSVGEQAEILRDELWFLAEPRASTRQRYLEHLPEGFFEETNPFVARQDEWHSAIDDWERLRGESANTTEEP